MKRKLTFLLTALLLLTGMASWGQLRTEASIDFAEQGYANAQDMDGVVIDIDDNVTIVFNKGTGSNGPKYYNTGTAIRAYGGNNFVVSSTSTISSIELTFSSGEGTNAITTEVGTYSAPTWTGSSSEVTFTIGGTSGHRRVRSVSVTYTSGGQPSVATPTFSPAGGSYFEAQSVSISCATDEATIRYTTDGSDPTESSSQYSSPLSINTTTTLKAKAFKSGYIPSNIATATYTFPTLVTIAEAKTLAVNEYALVQGVVNFIDNRNAYVQDETGGICLFLNNNTVPSTLALGDMVRAYGRRANYNGLFELSSINGSNTNEFSILSSGNTLPLVTKTIAEVLADGEDALQCTRVKIESATIGAINTGGNTPLTQGESSTNIYKVPELTGIEEGDEVDVIGVVGYFNAPQIRVAQASDITLSYIANPQLNVSVNQLSGFQYTYGAGPSQPKNFTLSGSDLSANVVVTASQDFEVALNASGSYTSSLTITPTDGTVTKTVYVRMKEGLNAGDYTGNVSITCGSLSQSIALNGTVEEQPIAEAPTFSPEGGNYLTAQNVSLSCVTPDASIHYTTNGSDPTENSPVYSTLITVSTTTTIKAMATASGYANSAIASATYTINETMTIAEARALNVNEYGCIEGTVIFIDARNVYVQDATAGIVLYLNNNTVPSSLAVGDNVRAYGKRANYNGLAELSGINGGNANEFTVLSHNNTLPLAVKTIAEINTDYSGNNMLQSTRVKIIDAIIGTINTNGNTVISQGSNNINVYRIPAVEGMMQGDMVTMTGIIGCYNAPQLRVASADDILFEHRPVLTANQTSLSGFTYTYEEGGPSEIMGTELSGNYLVGPALVYPSENFEISSLGGDLFHSENPAIIYNAGHFSGIMIYVRMKAGLEAGTYNEQFMAVSEGADTLYINVSGTVTNETPTPPTPPDPPTPGDDNYVRISDLSSLTAGSYVVFAARFDDNATDYYAMSNSSSGKPSGVLFTSATADENEVLPASIVDEESNYYWTVGVTANGYTFSNANGELIGYTSSTNFTTGGDNTEWAIELGTAGDEAMVPGYTGFVISNVNNAVRCFALNSNHNFGPYHTNNLNNSGYNFYLDLFVKTEGGDPPTPPTPIVATPTFSPAGGFYFEEQTVSITCATDGATIYYSTVSENGPWTAYTEAITVEESMTLWAYAEKEGYNNSAIAEATYTIQVGMVTIFNQDWEGEMNGWTFVTVVGDKPWNVSQYQGNHYAYANGYNGGVNEQWCISPAFNINDYENVTLTFINAKNYTGPDLELKYSTNYDGVDPTTASWWTFDFNMSPGSYTWTESGDIHISVYPSSSTNCYIAFKYTSTETEAAAWEVDDITLMGATSVPNISVTPNSLSGFTHVVGEGPSESQYFTLSGVNIGPAPGGGSTGSVIIQSMENEFEISFDNEEFTWQLYIDDIAGTLAPTPIYVRMNGAEVGQYSGVINIYASSSDEATVTLSGTVTEQPVPGDDYVRISDVSQLVDGNRIVFAARFDENAAEYYAMSNAASGKPTGVLFTSELNGSDEILPTSILNEEDNFYWTVNVTADGYTFTNANGQMIGWENSTNFSPNGDNTAWSIEIGTSEETAMVPNYTGFVISNVNNPIRAFALNNSHNFGPYHTQNIAGENYNFFLDIFMQGEGGACTVAAPTFDPAGGTYYETIDVTLSCTTPDATIWYSTISGNGPWTPYIEPITVEEFASIWAYASKEGCNDSPVVNASYIIQDDLVILFNQDWEDGWQGWTEYCETGDSLWRIASYQGNHYAYANGYNHPATIDWLISPAFDLDSYSNVMLTFLTAMNYNGPAIEVFFSNNYDGQDPTIATWEALDYELSPGSWNWIASGEISLDEFNGSNCHIAFRYICTGDEAAGWEVDDIMLVSGSATPTPTLTATPNTLCDFEYMEGEGPSASQSYTLTGANLEGEDNVTITVSSYFEISTNNESFGMEPIEIPYADGQLDDQPVTIYVRMVEGLEAGTYTGTIHHEGGNAITEVSLCGTVHSENEPIMSVLIPLYIQGNNGSNNNRVPMAAPAQFVNFEPNTTYRYTNQFVDENDGPETAGAGNVIYANPDGFYRSTSPSLATEGGYGEFTTDEYGEAIVFLMNEPTANARFTPGNQVFMRIRINDGHDGTTVEQVFTSEDYAIVLNFGTENDEYSGSAFYVKSNEAPMTFAALYTDVNHMDRPVYSTPIETTGVDYGSINQYADFYKEEVAGNDGWFGGILPNVNETGINLIWIYGMDGTSVEYETLQGHWNPDANTVNPTNGLDEPIFIDLTDDGVEEDIATNMKVWSSNHEFVIENGDNAHYTMTVYNVLGQPMMQRQINAGSTERICHSLATGVYVIYLQNNQNKVSVKVVVR